MIDKNKFNAYCVEIMGLTIDGLTWYEGDDIVSSGEAYNPYNDLNQMAEVVEKLIKALRKKAKHRNTPDLTLCLIAIERNGEIKQSFRDFIISTMTEES